MLFLGGGASEKLALVREDEALHFLWKDFSSLLHPKESGLPGT